jgi:hypothetical protein
MQGTVALAGLVRELAGFIACGADTESQHRLGGVFVQSLQVLDIEGQYQIWPAFIICRIAPC